jgi:tRNA(fMet)-specific endonuclease VapC
MGYMLDTNICIYIIKKQPRQVLERLKRCRIDDVGISSITLAELEYGAAKSSNPEKNRQALALFLAPLKIFAFDDRSAVSYGELRAFLERIGMPIGSMDLLIAAHALSLSLILVTNNIKEFSRIPGIQLENWAALETD